jgi:hypothetical protein
LSTANFKLRKQKDSLSSVEKWISRSDSDTDVEFGVEPPQYNKSSVDDGVNIGERSLETATRVTPVRPGQVHVEMVPV